MACNCGKGKSSKPTSSGGSRGTTAQSVSTGSRYHEVVVNGKCSNPDPADPTRCRGTISGGVVKWRTRSPQEAATKARALGGYVR